MKKVYSKKIFEAKNYSKLYHILDFKKLKYVFENNHFKPYRAANGAYISFTRNKMMNSYLGDNTTSFFKLELDGEKLSNNHKIKPFSYISATNVRFQEWEEIVKTNKGGLITNIDKYVTKLIIIKSKIESLMEVHSWSRSDTPSDYFTTAGTRNGTMPEIFKYVVENSPFDIYVQEGSVIKKDDEYIKSIINYDLHKVEFKYDIWYRGNIKQKRTTFGSTDALVDSEGNVYPNWVVGHTYNNIELKDKDELDINQEPKEFKGGNFIEGEKYKPYILKFRKTPKGYYMEDARPLDWLKPDQFFESLNESYVANPELVKHHIRQMIKSIQKKSKNKITNSQLRKGIATRHIEVKFNDIIDYQVFEKVLKSYQKKLLDYNIVIGYDMKDGYDTKLGNDLGDIKSIPNGKKDFYIHIKDLHTMRVKPPKYVYHFSDKKNRESILKDGLKPMAHKDSERWKEISLTYPPAVFATLDRDMMWHHDEWKIDTEGLDNKWWKDINFFIPKSETSAIMTFDNIPSECLTLVNP